MKLFYAPNSAALSCLIALEESGSAYDAMRVDFKTEAQKSPEYLSLNPKGRVPALVVGDVIITETPAVLTYIAQTNPDAGLLPSDPLTAAKVHEFNSFMCSTVHVSHAHRGRGHRWSDDAEVIEKLKVKVVENLTSHFTYLEARFDGPWVMGDAYSIADPYLFTVGRWLKADGVDIALFPRIADHQKRMADRPAVQNALQLQS